MIAVTRHKRRVKRQLSLIDLYGTRAEHDGSSPEQTGARRTLATRPGSRRFIARDNVKHSVRAALHRS